VKHIRKRTIQTGRLFFSSSLTFKQHLLSLTQGTNNREAEKPTITEFVKEPENLTNACATFQHLRNDAKINSDFDLFFSPFSAL